MKIGFENSIRWSRFLCRLPDIKITWTNPCLDVLVQFKNTILNILSGRTVIYSEPTLFWTEKGKAALTLQHLDEHLHQLNLNIIDHSNIMNTGLYLNPNGKGRLALNFIHKIRKNYLFRKFWKSEWIYRAMLVWWNFLKSQQ